MPAPDILPTATDCLFSSAAWRRVLAKAYGIETVEVMVPSGRSVPYTRLEDVGGTRVSCLPFSDYLPLAAPRDATSALTQLKDLAPGAPLTIKTALSLGGAAEAIASFEAGAGGTLAVSREAVLHVILPDAKPSSRFGANARRATRDGVKVRRVESLAALDRFYALFAALRTEKFGSIPQPLAFFRAVYDEFVAVGRGYFLEAVYEGRVIASFYLLEAGERLYYKFSASSLEKLVPRPNNLLFTHLLEEIHGGRYAGIDLGLSGASLAYEGLRYFKSTTGASVAPLHYLQYTPHDYDPAPRRAHLARMGAVTKAMTEASLSIEQLSRLSEAIYPSFA